MRFLITYLMVLVGLGTLVAQEREVFTDHPPITTGVFANWSYPAAPILENKKTFRLRRGILRPTFDKDGYIERAGAYLRAVEFVDITGDGVKEGIATVGPVHNGTAVWYGIYIYSMSVARPGRLLWYFASGDRGVGGLKKVTGKKGQLLVELWGWNSGPDSPPTTHIDGWAGSPYFTRRIYSWNGSKFVQKGRARIFEDRRP